MDSQEGGSCLSGSGRFQPLSARYHHHRKLIMTRNAQNVRLGAILIELKAFQSPYQGLPRVAEAFLLNDLSSTKYNLSPTTTYPQRRRIFDTDHLRQHNLSSTTSSPTTTYPDSDIPRLRPKSYTSSEALHPKFNMTTGRTLSYFNLKAFEDTFGPLALREREARTRA